MLIHSLSHHLLLLLVPSPSPSGRVGVAIQDAPVGEGCEAQQHGVEGEVAEGGEGIPAVQAEEEMEYVEA